MLNMVLRYGVVLYEQFQHSAVIPDQSVSAFTAVPFETHAFQENDGNERFQPGYLDVIHSFKLLGISTSFGAGEMNW